jgi:hypothetical protein
MAAVLDEVRPAVHDKRFGATHVIDITVETREDSQGEQALFFTLVLGAPPAGSDSWPLEDLRAVRDLLRGVIGEMDLPLSWYVAFEPEHPDLEDDQMSLDV